MTRRRLAALVFAVLALGLPRTATAASAPTVGWWFDDSVPGVSSAPSVPPGGFYVAGRLTGPEAIAAVRYTIDEGEEPEALTLALDSSSGTVALDACPPAAPWTPAEHGEWSDRPTQDCGEGGSRRVTGTVDAAASTVTFALDADLVSDGLDLVIVPGIDPATSTTAVFQATFEPPTPESLTVSGGGSSSEEETAPTANDSAPEPEAPGTPIAPSTPTTASFELSPASEPAAPSEFNELALESSDTGLGAAFDAGGPDRDDVTDRGPLTMSGARRTGAVLVALTMLLLLLWVNRDTVLQRAGVLPVEGSQPRPLSPSSPRVVGVGRFARPRRGSAPPL